MALGKLVKLLKRDLRYAEISVEHEEQLGALGWGGRRRRTLLAVPGQVLGIQIIEEGEGWIALRWRKPVDGGKPAAYKVQVRRRQGGPWEEAGVTVQRKLLVQNQQRGVELEYRVIAVNRAGDGKESGLVAAVL